MVWEIRILSWSPWLGCLPKSIWVVALSVDRLIRLDRDSLMPHILSNLADRLSLAILRAIWNILNFSTSISWNAHVSICWLRLQHDLGLSRSLEILDQL